MRIVVLAALLASPTFASCFVKLPTQQPHWVNAHTVVEVIQEAKIVKIYTLKSHTSNNSVNYTPIEFRTLESASQGVLQFVAQLNQCAREK